MEISTIVKHQDDSITIEDDQGNEHAYIVDAFIEMGNKTYIIYTKEEETIISILAEENGQKYLGEASDEEIDQILKAYNEALLKEDE